MALALRLGEQARTGNDYNVISIACLAPLQGKRWCSWSSGHYLASISKSSFLQEIVCNTNETSWAGHLPKMKPALETTVLFPLLLTRVVKNPWHLTGSNDCNSKQLHPQ